MATQAAITDPGSLAPEHNERPSAGPRADHRGGYRLRRPISPARRSSGSSSPTLRELGLVMIRTPVVMAERIDKHTPQGGPQWTTGSLIPSAGAHGALASIRAIKIPAGRGLRAWVRPRFVGAVSEDQATANRGAAHRGQPAHRQYGRGGREDHHHGRDGLRPHQPAQRSGALFYSARPGPAAVLVHVGTSSPSERSARWSSPIPGGLADSFSPPSTTSSGRQIPFIIALNCFDGARRYDTEDVRMALDLEPGMPIVRCDARSKGIGQGCPHRAGRAPSLVTASEEPLSGIA